MKNLAYVLPFVALTFFSWGVYGPVLHVGQELMAESQGLSTLRPFICVGIAYFLIAVVFPMIVLSTKGEVGSWTFQGTLWSFYAGAIGAIGALGIILAFKFRGAPIYVMPLVFGCAPVVNTFVTMFMSNTFNEASKKFYFAILVVALGAAGVMANKPASAKKAKPVQIDENRKIVPAEVNGEPVIRDIKTVTIVVKDDEGNEVLDDEGNQTTKEEEVIVEHAKDSVDGKPLFKEYQKRTAPNLLLVALSIALTAACWGSYGPVLHRGQMKMGGSKMRPFMCVGLAYFAIAVIIPILLLPQFPEKGAFDFAHFGGISWSLFAGTVGALGALGIIYAFNFGGKPIFVMPLVFGMAPVINTFTTIVTEGLYNKISSMFYYCLLAVIVGAVCVLLFAPRPKPKGKPDSKESGGKPSSEEKSSSDEKPSDSKE